ncbi:hypothetical protein OKW45_003705 [Paraburkholderia sp. WSM4175]|uniref:hypothetical protein n=1 Tax=Paraburkholderia sp. WSM4175 TaxID=2991072 RepID=UPI003D1E4696
MQKESRKETTAVIYPGGAAVRLVEFKGRSAALLLDLLNAVTGDRVRTHLVPDVTAAVKVYERRKWVSRWIASTVDNAVRAARDLGVDHAALAQLESFGKAHIGNPVEVRAPAQFKHEYAADEDLMWARALEKLGFTKDVVLAEYLAILNADGKARVAEVSEPPKAAAQTREIDANEIAKRALEMHRHEEAAAAARAQSLRRCEIFKLRHCIEHLDHDDPTFRAFTDRTYGEYLRQRSLATQARERLRIALKHFDAEQKAAAAIARAATAEAAV